MNGPAGAAEQVVDIAGGETIRYETIVPDAASAASALGTARRILRHLAAGDLEDAAVLSNAPKRRFEVLRDYRASVGEEEFKRVFARLLSAERRSVREIAIGPHHLLVWDVRGADRELAAQYYVNVEGRYFMDDVPGETRAQLMRVLRAWREQRAAAKPSGGTD
ncbi:MAG: hypothetical protein ACM30H_05835 [Clostridia bacterium]